MDLGIENRTALVLGASRGLGRAIAEALGREGVRVAISVPLGRRARGGRRRDRRRDGGPAGRHRRRGAVAALPGRVAEALGPIEILVLNTGGPPPGGALDSDPEAWRSAFQSLVLTPLILARACVPGMRERGWGRIVNVSSTSVREPIQGLALSNSNRMAALGLLNTLAVEVAGDGITVNTIATGRFGTERLEQMYGSIEAAEERARADVPAGRLGTPQEYGELVAFVCSQRAAYLTGAVIPLDGGLTRSS